MEICKFFAENFRVEDFVENDADRIAYRATERYLKSVSDLRSSLANLNSQRDAAAAAAAVADTAVANAMSEPALQDPGPDPPQLHPSQIVVPNWYRQMEHSIRGRRAWFSVNYW